MEGKNRFAHMSVHTRDFGIERRALAILERLRIGQPPLKPMSAVDSDRVSVAHSASDTPSAAA
jgi:hypothetical protein